MDDFSAWFEPFDYFQQPDFLHNLQTMEQLQNEQFAENFSSHNTEIDPSSETTSYDTPTSSDSRSDDAVSASYANKRRLTSSPSKSETLVRSRKTRKLRAPHETAKVREKGACYLCQLKRRECQDGDDPEGSCQRCLEHVTTVAIIPGLLRPVCWRPNLGYTKLFRQGPTIDFAASLRGNSEDEAPSKQALWKHFATKRSGYEPTKVVQLTQHLTWRTLDIPLDRYQPKKGDKQYYPWFDNGAEQRYQTPAYGIANLHVARSGIEKFLEENFAGYIEGHMRTATDITRKTFQTAQEHKVGSRSSENVATEAQANFCKHRLPLIAHALKLWVCCRFIEDPWSIVGSETLGMSLEANPNCPYHERIPVPPIVDLQIDLIVINELLKPELRNILKMLKSMLESSKPWMNWFEIYLAYFILLNNVELTIAHDLWFVKRHNLKRRYSNKALIDTITQGATTLLTCFHYAHQGYAPFSNLALEYTQHRTEAEKEYLGVIGPMLESLRGGHVNDPAKELFWTSQLHKPDWRPVVLMA